MMREINSRIAMLYHRSGLQHRWLGPRVTTQPYDRVKACRTKSTIRYYESDISKIGVYPPTEGKETLFPPHFSLLSRTKLISHFRMPTNKIMIKWCL